MIKLIASDVDGTLVEDGTMKLNPEYYDVIRELDRRRILFVAASGRQYSSVRKLFAPVLDKMDIITESGAAIWKKGVPFVPNAIPEAYMKEMTADAEKIPGMDYVMQTADRSFVPKEGTKLYNWLKDGYKYDLEVCRPEELPQGLKYTKLGLYYPCKAGEVTQEFQKKWESKVHLCLAGHMWLDCLMPGVNKGSALQLIQKELGILPSETVVFGDNQNDMELMDCAEASYAVSSAIPELKEKVGDRVIPSFTEDGVLGVLKKILDENK
jgi:Cof subfamily protein (haloacid dehalogenase superfamily)